MDPPVVAGDDGLAALVAGGPLDERARQALADGMVVVFDPRLLDRDGQAVFELRGDSVSQPVLRMPGHLAERETAYAGLPSALVPESIARAQGWEAVTDQVIVTLSADVTPGQAAAALKAAAPAHVVAFDAAGVATLDEYGARQARDRDLPLLALTAVVGVLTVAGVAVTVALSAAESRADLATLAAVGASPHRRRMLAACQALLIGGLGCVLGIAFGTFVVFTARRTTGSPDFVVPWANLALGGLVVPLLAALLPAALTPSRLPLARRTE
ncbi:MAG: FtsX-like permease family protein [Egibacteraceae bacterium]